MSEREKQIAASVMVIAQLFDAGDEDRETKIIVGAALALVQGGLMSLNRIADALEEQNRLTVTIAKAAETLASCASNGTLQTWEANS